MAELQMAEPQRRMMTGYTMLEHSVLAPVMMDDRSVLQAKAKFEDAFYNRDDKTPLHRKKVAASMVDAGMKAVDDPAKLADTKGIFVYLTRDESGRSWTERLNESLDKKRQQPLSADDIVVAIDSGKRNANDYVVIRKKTAEDMKYQ